MRLFFVSIKRKSNSEDFFRRSSKAEATETFCASESHASLLCCHKRILGRCNDRSVGIKDRLVIVEKDAHMASFIFNNQCVDGPRIFFRACISSAFASA